MELGSTVGAVRSQRVLMGHRLCPAVVRIKDGRIHRILSGSLFPAGDDDEDDEDEVLDVGDSVVMPGLVDSHVHVNEPGRVSWEGFWTATRAAAAGGVTTVVDMPLNSIPPTTTLNHFHEKLREATGKCFVDTAFWGGVIPGNQFHAELDVQQPSEETAGLPLFWSSASKRGFELSDVVRLLSQKTAQLCGLDKQKGSLSPGHDADLVIWDPEREFEAFPNVPTMFGFHTISKYPGEIYCLDIVNSNFKGYNEWI
ncbi:hypothetical protein F2P81_006109 [Scophthalmus maximus]|uniref:Amidohydrolase-related domain-containing protein n=1 Tax=Scophthalmus maximus TaxID=52904 RepID=A0A6A4T8C4_SCOMX|nr:hypothetical protein F2P81_006109 [Scophthalmus maximus]